MEFLYGIKEGKVYKVSIVKETEKQVKLEDGNGTGRSVVKKSDLDKIMGDKENTVIFSTNEDLIKEIWNAHMEEEIRETEESLNRFKSWLF